MKIYDKEVKQILLKINSIKFIYQIYYFKDKKIHISFYIYQSLQKLIISYILISIN